MPDACFTSEVLALICKGRVVNCPFCKQQSFRFKQNSILGDLFGCSNCGFTGLDHDLTIHTKEELVDQYQQGLEKAIRKYRKELKNAEAQKAKHSA